MATAQDARPDFGWQQSVLLAADCTGQARLTGDLIEAAGARLLGTLALADVAPRLELQARLDLLVIEGHDASPADLITAVEAIARFAEHNDAAVIVAIDDEQIDLVSTRMLGMRYAILCDADPATRFTAIANALARKRVPQFNDAGRDSEAARLRLLNEEVARIAATLARLTQSEPRNPASAMVSDRTTPYRASSGDTPPITAVELRQIIRTRRMRGQYFGNDLFEDPAWDMLLDLYAAHLENTQVSVSSLCIAAAVAPTTALRWIARMSDAGLFERHPDPFDRRRAYMALSAKAREGMAAYFAAAKRSFVNHVG